MSNVLAIEITVQKFISDDQPGWVECMLVDAWGETHIFHEKVPIVTREYLDADSAYPQKGNIACEILREWTDANGLAICTVNTAKPWGIHTVKGLAKFDLLDHQLTRSL